VSPSPRFLLKITDREVGIRKALYILGYYDVYHMTSFMNENPRDDEMWAAAADAKFYGKGHFGKAEWDQLLGHCMVYILFLSPNHSNF
jgi:Sulfotransferase domain